MWTGERLVSSVSPLNRLLRYRADDLTTVSRITEVVQTLSSVSVLVRHYDKRLALIADDFLLRCMKLLPEGTKIQLKLCFD